VPYSPISGAQKLPLLCTAVAFLFSNPNIVCVRTHSNWEFSQKTDCLFVKDVRTHIYTLQIYFDFSGYNKSTEEIYGRGNSGLKQLKNPVFCVIIKQISTIRLCLGWKERCRGCHWLTEL